VKEPEVRLLLVDILRLYDDCFRHKENLAYTLLAAEVALFGAIAYAPLLPDWRAKLLGGEMKVTILSGATIPLWVSHSGPLKCVSQRLDVVSDLCRVGYWFRGWRLVCERIPDVV
jgi:hypothetical protein